MKIMKMTPSSANTSRRWDSGSQPRTEPPRTMPMVSSPRTEDSFRTRMSSAAAKAPIRITVS